MNESNARLLIVDDDPELRDLLAEFLNKHGYVAHTVDGGAAMDQVMAKSPSYDLLILDLMLPGEGGLEIAKRLKQKVDIPIIILSALGEDVDRIIGLEVGADDYIAKPFNPRELLARIRAVMRRVSRASTFNLLESNYRFGEFNLNVLSHRLLRNDEDVPLTSGDFDLLNILVQNSNRVMDRDHILDLLTGSERSPFDRSIDVRITRLRSKIEPDPSSPTYIKTIWGKGYMFCLHAV